MKSRTSWREKLEKEQLIKIVNDPQGRRMLIPRPIDVDALVRKIGKGKLATVEQLRQRPGAGLPGGGHLPAHHGHFPAHRR